MRDCSQQRSQIKDRITSTVNTADKNIEARLASAPVVPLIQADDPTVTIATTNALIAGGLGVNEDRR